MAGFIELKPVIKNTIKQNRKADVKIAGTIRPASIFSYI